MDILGLLNADNFNLFTFGALIHNEQAAIQAAYHLQLISDDAPRCPRCHNPMKREVKESYKLGYRWACRRTACRVRGRRGRILFPVILKSPLEGTFFANVHLSFLQTLRLVVCWFFRIPVTQAVIHCEVNAKAAVDFYSFCREICRVAHGHQEQQIGGPGDVVECDESHLFTPKYHRGRPMEKALWVFGGMSRLTRKRFVVQIEQKDQETLFPLMQKHIAQDSFIMTDQALVYQNCDALGFSGHCAVNHSLTFVRLLPAFVPNGDPRLGRVLPHLNLTRVPVHTNTLERSWRDLKHGFLRNCRSIEMVPNYIGEYLYRRNILDDVPDHKHLIGVKMYRFFEDVRKVYPGPGKIPITIEDCVCDDCVLSDTDSD